MKINATLSRMIFVFYMSIMVSIGISFYFTLQQHALNSQFFTYWFKAFVSSFIVSAPIAFFCAPVANKLTLLTSSVLFKNTNQ